MKSFALLRTNVGLTTNIKIMIDSQYNLNLDSIDSISDLSIDKYKKVPFNKENYFDELVQYFFDGLPSQIAYHIKYDDDVDTMGTNFSNQYDEIYQYGARNITNNKNYKEEFEYFAPIYIFKNNLPKKFIIFRADGPGLTKLNKSNFKGEILDKLKVVKMFDLTKESSLGVWLHNNFDNNKFFPDTPLEMDFRSLEFCKWNGIDYDRGGYISKSLFIDDILGEEKEIFELEKFIFSKYKDNKVVFPNILNLSFLFDDEPSTPEYKRKWSLNRYFGFYLEDMELVKTISPYITPLLRDDVIIDTGNILYSSSGKDAFLQGWSDDIPFYVEYNGVYYKVEKFFQNKGKSLGKKKVVGAKSIIGTSNPSNTIRVSKLPKYAIEDYEDVILTKYRIISDIDLSGKQSLLNKNFGYINSTNVLEDYYNNFFVIENFNDADIWLIEIDGIYHKLANSKGGVKIVSDYSFSYSTNDYKYTVAGITTTVSTIVDFNNSPKEFKIYRLKLSDIKDFDDKIIDTEFSKYEYEDNDDLTSTDESKMYYTNLNSNTNPKELDDFIYKGKVVNIPVSSEYTANHETFKIERINGEDELSDIWRKNPIYCRWVFQNSLSSNDYPYLLNNSEIFEDFNRVCNTFDSNPKRIERNLDYFYTVNSSTASHLHHSLHVESLKNSGRDIDTSFRFELDKYLNVGTYSVGTSSATYSFDYFSYFFDRKSSFLDGKITKNTKKYSNFNVGDSSIPNVTLFKGIKFIIYNVDSIKKDSNGDIDIINLKTSNEFDGYKFSILLSDNEWSVDYNGKVMSSGNSMSWTVIDEWEMDKTYLPGTIGVSNDILYLSTTLHSTKNPIKEIGGKQVRSAPHNQTTDWTYYGNTYSIFWRPNKIYNTSSSSIFDYVVYNDGDYYKYSSGIDDFWNPATASSTGYNMGSVVLFKNKYYMSTTSSNHYSPDYIIEHNTNPATSYSLSTNIPTWSQYWVATQSSSVKWSPIQLWNNSSRYFGTSVSPTLIVYNDIIYKLITTAKAGDEPGTSEVWTREYSLLPDTDFIYGPTSNPIIKMNNKYYLINSNTSNSTLDNGIIIYINKKWKNILVNINIADNTLSNLSETDRDDLYTDLNKKITAANFISAVNDIKNKYDFTDYISYVIIDETGKISKYNYNNNVEKLPYIINCESPEDLDIKINSLNKIPIQLTGSLVAKKSLINGTIKDINSLNYYNNNEVASQILENKDTLKVFENYHDNKNFTKSKIYRFSGYYMPLFYDIQLFEKNYYTASSVGNYKFDTTLTNFGMMLERKIRKINKKESILKLRNVPETKSIYPMLDEMGYTYVDFFIFSSTWDFEYHTETSDNVNISLRSDIGISKTVEQISAASEINDSPNLPSVKILDDIGQPNISSNTNQK